MEGYIKQIYTTRAQSYRDARFSKIKTLVKTLVYLPFVSSDALKPDWTSHDSYRVKGMGREPPPLSLPHFKRFWRQRRVESVDTRFFIADPFKLLKGGILFKPQCLLVRSFKDP